MEINSYYRMNSAYPSAVNATSRVRRVENERTNVASLTKASSEVNDVVSISSKGRAYLNGAQSLNPVVEVAEIQAESEGPKTEDTADTSKL